MVQNIIIADDDFALEGYELVTVDDIPCNIGDSYVDGVFISPELETVE